MSEPFVGEIRMFAGNFAPRGWSFCDGQLLAVSSNDALFSLFGTIYGGDGETTFGLPDLRGRLPVHAGSGPGLSPRRLGQKGGEEQVTLTVNELPSHEHTPLNGSASSASDTRPVSRKPGRADGVDAFSTRRDNVRLAGGTISSVGGSRSHTNLMPTLCVHFIVALFGIYPSAN